uniref:CRAL-TRIO domain-containing protein n=1 Tax=Acrobeloides nanus TaxID=290746 RepID=A0A914EAY8_9BILA
MRWLIAWNYKIDEIVPKYKKLSNVMKCLKLNELEEIDDFDKINEYVAKLVPGAKYFPGGLMGYDKEGYVIIFQAIAQTCPKELVKCGRVSDMYHMALIDFVLTYKLIRKQEKIHKRRLGIKLVCDTDGWSMDLLYMPTVKMYMNLIRFVQEMFPELAKTLIVINAPPMMSTIYQLFKPAFAEATREKIVFYGKDYKSKLTEEFGAEHLFEKWGGSKLPQNGVPTGSLRVGAPPPDHIKYDPTKNPHHIDNKKLTKLN